MRSAPRSVASLLLVLLVAFAPQVEAKARRSPRTWIARDGIELNDLIRDRVSAVAAIYYAKTKRTLEVTSGYRSPSRQADAMYGKLVAGGSLAIYKNQALVAPLMKAYREGRKKRWKRDRIVAAMAAVLADQVERGHYLSRHMRGRAFDLRSSGMSGRQREALRAAIAEVGGMRVIYESKPPHFHVEILPDKKPDAGSAEDLEGAHEVDEDDLRDHD